jgi:tRNA-guanine family transglycosylase
MRLYHVIMGNTDVGALKMYDDNSVNLLMAASMQTFDKRWKNNLAFIQKKKRSLYSDSGMIGWIKKLKEDAWKYAINPELVLNIQLQLDPDIVAHVDIPSEPSILKMLGKDIKETMRQTVENAEWLVDQSKHPFAGEIPKNLRLIGRKIAIGVQGWTVKDYTWCVNQYRDMGFDELDPEQYMFAIGSVCMRKPPSLYEVSQAVRNMIPDEYDIHCYGIASVPWMLQLEDMGITSCDSSSANVAATYFRLIGEDGKRVDIGLRHKDTQIQNSLVAFNMASIDYQLRNKLYPIMDELFYDECEQLMLEDLE